MLALTSQTIGVVLIVAVAIAYLAITLRRSLKGGSNSGCGSCHSTAPRTDEQSKPQSSKAFLPAENLADAARRHASERASHSTK